MTPEHRMIVKHVRAAMRAGCYAYPWRLLTDLIVYCDETGSDFQQELAKAKKFAADTLGVQLSEPAEEQEIAELRRLARKHGMYVS